jgi:hypothetical protein
VTALQIVLMALANRRLGGGIHFVIDQHGRIWVRR